MRVRTRPRTSVCARAQVCVYVIYHRDRLVRVYLMMWGFIYEVMADVWEGEGKVREGERLRQPEDVTLKYHQGDGCPCTQH